MDYTHVVSGGGGALAGMLISKLIAKGFDLRVGLKDEKPSVRTEMYWQKMKEVVTEPLAEALKELSRASNEQARGMNDVLREIARIEGRTSR